MSGDGDCFERCEGHAAPDALRAPLQQVIYRALHDEGISFRSATAIPAVTDAVLAEVGKHRDAEVERLDRALDRIGSKSTEYAHQRDATADPVASALTLHGTRVWAVSMPGGVETRREICKHDLHDWPCPTRAILTGTDQ